MSNETPGEITCEKTLLLLTKSSHRRKELAAIRARISIYVHVRYVCCPTPTFSGGAFDNVCPIQAHKYEAHESPAKYTKRRCVMLKWVFPLVRDLSAYPFDCQSCHTTRHRTIGDKVTHSSTGGGLRKVPRSLPPSDYWGLFRCRPSSVVRIFTLLLWIAMFCCTTVCWALNAQTEFRRMWLNFIMVFMARY